MKELNTVQSLAVTLLIIIATSILSINSREINSSVISIEKGMSLNSVSELLYDNDLIINKYIFKLKVILRGLETKVPTGKFLIEGKVSDSILIELIFNNGPIKLKLTIPEGLQSQQLFENINLLLDKNYDFNRYFKSEKIIKAYNIDASSLEGYLFPETYYLYHDSSPEEILNILLSEFWKQFDNNLQERANQLGFSVHEVVTLASIIEGEAMISSERSTISSVYHNRLKINMKLQADPTIQYIIDDSPRRLLNRDLKIDSRYNTYLHKGLPPGPINSPGRESLIAALYPEKNDYIYFVARGDGFHTFSINKRQHNIAKKQFQIVRNKYKKKKNNAKTKIK